MLKMNEESILFFRKELQNLGYSKTVVNNYPKQIRAFLSHFKKHFTEIYTQDILDYHNYLKTCIGKRTKKLPGADWNFAGSRVRL